MEFCVMYLRQSHSGRRWMIESYDTPQQATERADELKHLRENVRVYTGTFTVNNIIKE